MSQMTLPWKHPQVDGEIPDTVVVKINGTLEEVLRPIRRGETVYLVIEAHAAAVTAKEKEGEDGTWVERTVTLKPDFGAVLTEEVAELTGTDRVKLIQGLRTAHKRDLDLASGQEALPLEMYGLDDSAQ